MNFKKVSTYKAAADKLPQTQYAWPLFGPGLENLGQNAAPILNPVPEFSDSELLVRIDAVSLCYTDLKEIDQAQNHPRLKDRDLQSNPIIPGHEVSMTVVGVGKKLADQYKIGNRFTIQPDVWVDGKSIPFCFGMDGGYRQFAKIGREILRGDAGNYLIPVPDEMTYAAIAITEPWACVEAAYRMEYRSTLELAGVVLVWGDKNTPLGLNIEEKWVCESKPSQFILCDVPSDLEKQITAICSQNKIDCVKKTRPEILTAESAYDDLILLNLQPADITEAACHMKNDAVLALVSNNTSHAAIEIDLGRLHYDNILYVGTTSNNIGDAYQSTKARSEFKKHGTAWILGSGGPMGRMHLQRAIEASDGPKRILATEVSSERLTALDEFFGPLATHHGKELILINPVEEQEKFSVIMKNIMQQGGVDDIEVMVTFPNLVAEACNYLAPYGGAVNLFAGMKRGVKVTIDAQLIFGQQQVRFVGHSGSDLEDQKAVVQRATAGQLKPQLSVAAIGGLCQINQGVEAMKNSRYPGKIVIYPQIHDFPLTSLKEMKDILPEVYDALGNNDTWNSQAENTFLEKSLP